MDSDSDGLTDAPKWSMPEDFPSVPAGFGTSAGTVIKLQDLAHQQLLDRAAESNKTNGIPEDPFNAVLHGIPERAQLRPDSKEPESHYMGLQGLRPHGKYAKAWRKVLRGAKQSAAGKAGPAKRAKGGAAAEAGEAKAKAAGRSDKASGSHPSQWTKQQLQPVLPSEQQRWRSILAAFLGRPVDVPLLAPGAPVLDMQQLLTAVMQQGGKDRVTAASGWSALAQHMQRDASFGPLLAAVYDCYLHPLEQDLPFAFRAAKARDHMISRTQTRAVLGAKLATHDSVVHYADKAAASLHRLQQLLQEGQEQQQQRQRQPWTSKADSAADKEAAQQEQQQQHSDPTQISTARSSLQLLQQAAREPEVMLQQLRQLGLRGSSLHPASKQACMQEYKRKLLGGRKRGRPPELWEDLETEDLFGLGSDSSDDEDGDSAEVDAGAAQDGTAAATASKPPPLPAAAAAAGDESAAAGARRGRGRPKGSSSKAGRAAASGGRGRGRGNTRSSRAGQAATDGNDADADDTAAAAAAAAAASGAASGADHAADTQQEVADAQGRVDTPAASAQTQPQQQQDPQQQLLQSQRDSLVLDASRWLLLSHRATLSGPPGCRKPLLQLPGMQEREPEQERRRSSGSGRGRGRGRGGKKGGDSKRTRTFMGRTPRCGSCHTCLNPSLKKACPVNRERMRKGQQPLQRGGRGKKRR